MNFLLFKSIFSIIILLWQIYRGDTKKQQKKLKYFFYLSILAYEHGLDMAGTSICDKVKTDSWDVQTYTNNMNNKAKEKQPEPKQTAAYNLTAENE